jgi:signal transduction histidine kinase
MNCVLGMSHLLTATQLDDEQQQYVGMIVNSGKLLLAIINDVLDYSRIESGKLSLEAQPLSILECIETTLHLCSDMALQKGLELVYIIDPKTPSCVLGDTIHLQQILSVARDEKRLCCVCCLCNNILTCSVFGCVAV